MIWFDLIYINTHSRRNFDCLYLSYLSFVPVTPPVLSSGFCLQANRQSLRQLKGACHRFHFFHKSSTPVFRLSCFPSLSQNINWLGGQLGLNFVNEFGDGNNGDGIHCVILSKHGKVLLSLKQQWVTPVQTSNQRRSSSFAWARGSSSAFFGWLRIPTAAQSTWRLRSLCHGFLIISQSSLPSSSISFASSCRHSGFPDIIQQVHSFITGWTNWLPSKADVAMLIWIDVLQAHAFLTLLPYLPRVLILVTLL